jgi:hypothetical protein
VDKTAPLLGASEFSAESSWGRREQERLESARLSKIARLPVFSRPQEHADAATNKKKRVSLHLL